MRLAGQAQYRRSRLNSNVRPHRSRLWNSKRREQQQPLRRRLGPGKTRIATYGNILAHAPTCCYRHQRPVAAESTLGVTNTNPPMSIILRVLVNGEEFVVAGEASLSVLGAHVSATGKLGPDSQGTWHPRRPGPNIDLSVGGLTSRGDRRKDEHLRWGPRLPLEPGDTVTIEVLDSGDFQPPTNRHAADTSSSHGLTARLRWLNARSLYFRLRERFGSRAEKQDARYRRHIIKSMRAERG
jgi:hypothetical protein